MDLALNAKQPHRSMLGNVWPVASSLLLKIQVSVCTDEGNCGFKLLSPVPSTTLPILFLKS